MATPTVRQGTYQMLWDCPSCSTTKLLGVDHRHCPNCGAPQEERRRYFPSKEERVPTVFRGSTPDWECRHCGTPCAVADGFCMGCGAPRGDSPSVAVLASIPSDVVEDESQAAESGPRSNLPLWTRVLRFTKRRRKPITWSAVGLAGMGLVWFACVDKQVDLVVDQHSWTRTIPVERFQTMQDSAWCDATPIDARMHSRSREIHHHDKIPDGEDCRDVPESCSNSCRNVDNGNGSFSEVCTESCTPASHECTTRYRDEPVYADKCYYEVDRWLFERAAMATGIGLHEPDPTWPAEPAYSSCPSERLGCERLGARTELYEVHFLDEDGSTYACPFAQTDWSSIPLGARWTGGVSRLDDELDCESLAPTR